MKEKLKVWSKKWWFWVIVVILFFGIIGSFTEDEEETSSNASNNNTKQEETTETKKEDTITKQENKSGSKKTEKVVFLDGTNSEDFASILSSVTGISGISGLEMGDSITYAKSNDKYGIEMDADKKTKKIDFVQILCYSSDDATNVFMALNRMNYTTENDAELTDWLTKNIGKKATTKIGDANFELGLTTNNYPYINVKTDGSDDYQQEQIDKANN